jgi:hypothetical protein
MLLQNMEPRTISLLAKVHLIPGVNEIDDKKWAAVYSKQKRQVDAMVEEGRLKIVQDVATDGGAKEESKITLALIKETYDTKLLEKWLPESQGRLKGAITKQIELMSVKPKKED